MWNNYGVKKHVE